MNWQPGDPLYDQSDRERVYQWEPIFKLIENDEGWDSSARWTPARGWIDWGVNHA